jgi:hypothetical protein
MLLVKVIHCAKNRSARALACGTPQHSAALGTGRTDCASMLTPQLCKSALTVPTPDASIPVKRDTGAVARRQRQVGTSG